MRHHIPLPLLFGLSLVFATACTAPKARDESPTRQPAMAHLPQAHVHHSGKSVTYPLGGDPVTLQVQDRNLNYPIAYVLGYQLLGLAVLSSLDKEITNFESFGTNTFAEGFQSGPRWDDDSWTFNYLAHPLWGSETYLRARAQNFTWFESFLFSTAASVIWEYGMENWTEHPSQQDLLVTSTAGAVLGEIRFRWLQQLQGKDTRSAQVMTFLLDPIQSLTKSAGSTFLGKDWEEPAFRPEASQFRLDPVADPNGGAGVAASWSFRF